MRLAANHPDLILKRQNANNPEPGNLVCGICQELAEDPIESKCKHVFCREDARQYLESTDIDPACPVCFAKLTIDLTMQSIGATQPAAEKQKRTSIIERINMNDWRSSTKVEALVEELVNIRQPGQTIKSIVFSQFVNFLDLVNWRLKKAGFQSVRLDGRMNPYQRDQVIKTFMEDANVEVFLVSLKAGGIALNLTAASNVFICDPWWNPAVESQAMDRIHRLGQFRPIKVTRLIIENSIESRIVQLQQKKQALVESVVGRDADALNRLSEEDLRFLFIL